MTTTAHAPAKGREKLLGEKEASSGGESRISDKKTSKADQKSDLAALRRWWSGGFRAHGHFSRQNVVNALLCLLGATPAIGLAAWVYTCNQRVDGGLDEASTMRAVYKTAGGGWEGLRASLLYSPLLLANVLFFVNVDVIFYVIGLAQKSFWLIDPYWTLTPPLLGLLWICHPQATTTARAGVANALTLVWAIRLTHSYFRR
jgi:hypothetical protein